MKRILAVLALTAAAASGPVGIFEDHADVGAAAEGAVVFNAATAEYRVTGGGANMWAGTDAFHFVWKRVTGDTAIAADVRFDAPGGDPHRKAVVIFRQDLAPGSPYADIALHGDGLTALQFRSTAGAVTEEVRSPVNGPVRLRLERRGSQFTVWTGKPGELLTSSGTATVALHDPLYVGIGVCAHDAAALETAVFSKVRVEQLPQQSNRLASKISVWDRESRSLRVIYGADSVFEAPNWSRDGRFLLVNSADSLYRLPLAGGEPVKMDLGAAYRCNNDHDFSADGKRLAFSATLPPGRNSQVFVAAADGKDARVMTPAEMPSYFHAWSPDGRWLAFVAKRGTGEFAIFRVPSTGGPEERLTSHGYDDGPDYSPDGKWIYFNSNRSGGWDIWRMPAAGAGPNDAKAEQVTRDEWEDWFPHVSPDGKWIVFLSFPKGTATHDPRMPGVQLRMIPAPRKTAKPAAVEVLATIFGGQGSINVNSWSHDSKYFAFVEYQPSW